MRHTLSYRGNGCGGCNLPFDTIADAVAYAKARGALSYVIELTATGEAIAQGRRDDCRRTFTASCDRGM